MLINLKSNMGKSIFTIILLSSGVLIGIQNSDRSDNQIKENSTVNVQQDDQSNVEQGKDQSSQKGDENTLNKIPESKTSKAIDQKEATDQAEEENTLNNLLPEEKALRAYKAKRELDRIKELDSLRLIIQDSVGLKIIHDEILDIVDGQIVNEIETFEDSIIEKSLIDTLVNFGYSIFKQDPSIFEPTVYGSIDPNYNIGPEDQIIIMLWGETQFRQVFTVDKEGFIFIPEIGQVYVNGLTLESLESKLFRIMSNFYATLNPTSGEATSFLDVSIGNLRPLRIFALGEVGQPGAYSVSPNATLFSSLYYFNGPSKLGTLRNIKLIRDNKEINNIDFYDYLLSGKKTHDTRLQLDDIIFFPKRGKTIEIDGEVNRPGIYELKEGEGLLYLIKLAGDLKITAYFNRIQIDRIVPFDERDSIGIDRVIEDVPVFELSNNNDYLLQDGDKIKIYSISEARIDLVTIDGSIMRPGEYDIGDSLRLSELISKAEGVSGDAYLDRIDVIRKNKENYSRLIKLNLAKVLALDPQEDILLQGLDEIKIYGKNELIPDRYVTLRGHVKLPGRYQLLEDYTLYDLIFKGGGFIDEEWLALAYKSRAELIRQKTDKLNKQVISFNLEEVLENKGPADMLLVPGDDVRIYSFREIEGDIKRVSIDGYVKYPGIYELFENNMSVYDLLFKAGGFGDLEFKKGLFTNRADIVRINKNNNEKKIIRFDIGDLLLSKGLSNNLKLEPNDLVKVYSNEMIEFLPASVTIDGLVNQPGSFELKQNMKVMDLILEAGGLIEPINIIKVSIARLSRINISKNTFSNIITFQEAPVNQYSYMDSSINTKSGILKKLESFILEPYDHVSIYSKQLTNSHRKVFIDGEVFYPGTYAITDPDEKVRDLIVRAGGIRPNAYLKASQLTRDGDTVNVSFSNIIKRENSKSNFKLIDGDSIYIANYPNIVKINGEVHSPGNYQYFKNTYLRGYISIAGGYTTLAEKKDIWVKYPDGTSKQLKRFWFSPKVYDGSEIIVGKIPVDSPFSLLESVNEFVTVSNQYIMSYLSLIILYKSIQDL